MSNIPHLPVLRLGRAYESLEKIEVKDHRTGHEAAPQKVMDGGIQEFIDAELRRRAAERSRK